MTWIAIFFLMIIALAICGVFWITYADYKARKEIVNGIKARRPIYSVYRDDNDNSRIVWHKTEEEILEQWNLTKSEPNETHSKKT